MEILMRGKNPVSQMIDHYKSRETSLLANLEKLVKIESPSRDKAAVDRVGELVSGWMRAAGGEVEIVPQAEIGDLVIGRWPGAAQRPGFMLLCHMDTIWPAGTLAERPPRVEGGKFYAPGAYDMKAGIVIALAALQGLNEIGLQPVAPLTWLCTSDEEIGSPQSRPLIEVLARASRLVLCLEPALPGGALKTARKGVGGYSIRVRGRAAHAGGNHEKGVNAIEEMAYQVLALQALTEYEKETTVNVGLIRGGLASNVVPDLCEAEVDFRVMDPGEADRLRQAIRSLSPRLPGTSLEVEGDLNRPPMPRDERMAHTFAAARRIATRHGLALQEGASGGASDANFTSALGVPTLDGLGADGDGAHAIHEHVRIASLATRAALLAALLTEWVE